MHTRLANIYNTTCDCSICKNNKNDYLTLDSKKNKALKRILNLAEKAFKTLHSRKGYKPEDLGKVPEYAALINDTASLLSTPIADNKMPAEMATALQSDAFLFGGLKVHAQLYEAASLLMKDGKLKPYNQLQQEFEQLNIKYNKTQLEPEYSFATHSSLSAARWANIEQDTARYLLQYRTAGDSRVRESHAVLNKTTLPATDAFWDSYCPPNGWRCRCLTIQVRAKDHPATDSETAIAAGEKATTQIGKDGKNRLELFRFNPGKTQKLFPPKHPHYPQHCDGEKLNMSGLIGYATFVLNAEKQRCKAKKEIEKMQRKSQEL